MQRTTLACRFASVWLTLTGFAAAAPSDEPAKVPSSSVVLFREGFDDSQLLPRGWYDGKLFKIASDQPFSGKGCIEYQWRANTTTPASSSGIRRLFEPTDTVYVRFRIRLSDNWEWTGRSYHPHLMHFMTTENGSYHGPAASHLTLYIEPQNGRLRLAPAGYPEQGRPSRPDSGAVERRLQREVLRQPRATVHG